MLFQKVFEALLLTKCEESLVTNGLQFCFKQGIECMDIIFSVKSVVDYFGELSSSEYASPLVGRKAFDSLNERELCRALLAVDISKQIE